MNTYNIFYQKQSEKREMRDIFYVIDEDKILIEKVRNLDERVELH